jgi:hypothetical protein
MPIIQLAGYVIPSAFSVLHIDIRPRLMTTRVARDIDSTVGLAVWWEHGLHEKSQIWQARDNPIPHDFEHTYPMHMSIYEYAHAL